MGSAEIGGVGQHGRMIKIKRENAGEISAETGIGKPEGHSSCPRKKVNEPKYGLPLLFLSFSLSIVNVTVFFAHSFYFLIHEFLGVVKILDALPPATLTTAKNSKLENRR